VDFLNFLPRKFILGNGRRVLNCRGVYPGAWNASRPHPGAGGVTLQEHNLAVTLAKATQTARPSFCSEAR